MREIKFRGLHVQKKIWVYGFLFANINPLKKETELIDHAIWEGLRGIGNLQQVIPETIGQFTGLKDKNGVEVFGGDILKIKLPMGGFWGIDIDKTGVVRYESDKGGFIVEWEYSKNQHFVLLDCDIAIKSESLGNVHENPELLK
jgi:uncharacterized phage protein (TIGR01671 family)